MKVSKNFSSNTFKKKDYMSNLREHRSLIWCQLLHRTPEQLIKVFKNVKKKKSTEVNHIGQTQPFP